MDDGGAHGSGLRIHTQSFTIKEVEILINALKQKFNLICTRHKMGNKYIIYINSKSINHLRSLVLPHICSSILYKLGL